MMRLLKSTLSAGLPFGVVMGLLFAVNHGLVRGLCSGLAAGLLFGLLLAVFTEVQRKKLQVGTEYQGERVLHQGPANHWRGGEARGGWLILTPQRLLFRAHGKNLSNQPIELSVASLRGTEFCRTLGIVPNGLLVLPASGPPERFVLSQRDEWAARIGEAIGGRPPESGSA